MFKRIMIGLVALGLAVIFIAEAADARKIIYRRSIENIHTCEATFPGTSIPDPCYQSTSVADRLIGAVVDTSDWPEKTVKALVIFG